MHPMRRRRATHLAEDRVFAVEVWLLCIRDEELGLVRVGTRIGHGENAAVVELVQVRESAPRNVSDADIADIH